MTDSTRASDPARSAHRPDPAVDGAGFLTLSAASILAETAARHPERTALYFAGAATTYAELWAQTRAYAGALRARGIGRGDRVAVVVPNVPDFPRVYYAVLALGAIVVPVHLLLKSQEIAYVLRDAGVDLVVAAAPVLGEVLPAAREAGVDVLTVLAPSGDDGPGLPRLEDEAAASEAIARHEAVHPTDAATILYTSGTTGSPKGAVSAHLTVVEQVHATLLDSIDLRPDDVVFGGLPLFHAFGQSAVMNLAFRRGAAVILLPRYDADEALRLLVEHGGTVFTAVPTMYIGLVEAAARAERLPILRFAISGGAALPVAVLEAFSATFGADVHEGYGLTETGPTATVNAVGEPIRPGTVGRALWGVDVAVADPLVDARVDLLPPGDLGEIVVRGHNLFKGYLGRPEASNETMVDGWLRTGDLGTLDADGIVTIVDRKKDMIVRNGYNVYPTEVENVLLRHPDVRMAAVYGVPHERYGQEIHAAVVARDGAVLDPEEVVAFVREQIAAFKYPRVVRVLDSLPQGPSGKILKRRLTADAGSPGPRTPDEAAPDGTA